MAGGPVRTDAHRRSAVHAGGRPAWWPAGGSGGRQLQQPAVAALAAVLQQPDGPVRTLFDLADATSHGEAFCFPGPVTLELDADQRHGGQSADEAGPTPGGEEVAVVDHEPCRRDYGRPGDHRGNEVRARVVVRDRGAVIVITIGNDRVAVISTAPDEVELVATLRPH